MLHLYIFLSYVGLSLIVGMMGEDRKFGFWGYFFGSLLFTPFMGTILVLASDPLEPDEEEE